MNVLKQGEEYIIYSEDGLSLLRALPDNSIPLIASHDSRIEQSDAQQQAYRALVPGGFLFAYQRQMYRVYPEFDVWHRHGSTVLGKAARRPFFHAVTCAEDYCDPSCQVFGLTTDRDYRIAFGVFPKGTMVDPFGGKDEFLWRQARIAGYSCLAGQ